MRLAPRRRRRAVLLTAALGARTAGSSPFCHVDVLVKNLDPNAISAYSKQELSSEVARAIAVETGINRQEVMTLDGQTSRVNVLSGTIAPPWVSSGWKTSSRLAGDPCTMLAGLVKDCTMAQFMADIFRNPEVHRAILQAVRNSLEAGGEESSREAMTGDLAVVTTSVTETSEAAVGSFDPDAKAPTSSAGTQHTSAAPVTMVPSAATPSLAPSLVPSTSMKPHARRPAPASFIWKALGILVVILAGLSLLVCVFFLAKGGGGHEEAKHKHLREGDEDEEEFTGH